MWRLALLLLAVAVVAAACGSSDDKKESTGTPGKESSDSGSAASCDSPGVSADAITIGAMISLTGIQNSVWKPTLPGIKARIDYQNKEKGGVNGRQIKLEVGDDGSDPQKATQTARELVEEKKAFAVIVDSAMDVQAGPYYEQNGIPVTGWAVSTAWGTHKNMFGFSGGNSPKPTPVTTGGEFLKNQGVSKLGVISYAFPASINAGTQYVTSFEKVTGNKAFMLGDAPLGNADWSVQAQQFKEAGADALYMPIGLQDAVNVYQAVLQAGVKLKVALFPAGYGPLALEQLGSKIEGASFSIDFVPFSEKLPAQKTVLEAIQKYAPDAPVKNEMTDQYTMVGWLSADAMIYGLEHAGKCPTRESFITNMRNTTDYDAGGLLRPAVNYKTNFGKPYLTCAYYTTVKNGQFVEDKPAPLCGKPIS